MKRGGIKAGGAGFDNVEGEAYNLSSENESVQLADNKRTSDTKMKLLVILAAVSVTFCVYAEQHWEDSTPFDLGGAGGDGRVVADSPAFTLDSMAASNVVAQSLPFELTGLEIIPEPACGILLGLVWCAVNFRKEGIR